MDTNETPDGEHRPITRRTYLAGAAAASVAGLAGCTGSDGGDDGATGQLATAVTDQPGDIADFESCVVTITGMWLGPAEDADDEDDEDSEDDEETADGADNMSQADADNETEDSDQDDEMDDSDDEMAEDDDEGGRTYYEYDQPQEADLVNLQGEQTQLVDDRELDVGEHAFLQLDIERVDATLDGGESAQVEVPGEAPLKFNESFEIRADTRTLFTADFTPVKRGRTGSYLLQPVASGVTVEYEEVESEDGENGASGDGGDNETTASDSE